MLPNAVWCFCEKFTAICIYKHKSANHECWTKPTLFHTDDSLLPNSEWVAQQIVTTITTTTTTQNTKNNTITTVICNCTIPGKFSVHTRRKSVFPNIWTCCKRFYRNETTRHMRKQLDMILFHQLICTVNNMILL